MEFPKRLYVAGDSVTALFAGRDLQELPEDLLTDGREVGVYLYRRTKQVEVTRKLKAIAGELEDDADPLGPAEQQLPLGVPDGSGA